MSSKPGWVSWLSRSTSDQEIEGRREAVRGLQPFVRGCEGEGGFTATNVGCRLRRRVRRRTTRQLGPRGGGDTGAQPNREWCAWFLGWRSGQRSVRAFRAELAFGRVRSEKLEAPIRGRSNVVAGRLSASRRLLLLLASSIVVSIQRWLGSLSVATSTTLLRWEAVSRRW